MSNYEEIYFEEEVSTPTEDEITPRSPEELMLWLLDFEG